MLPYDTNAHGEETLPRDQPGRDGLAAHQARPSGELYLRRGKGWSKSTPSRSGPTFEGPMLPQSPLVQDVGRVEDYHQRHTEGQAHERDGDQPE